MQTEWGFQRLRCSNTRKIFCVGIQDSELFVIHDGDDIGPYSKDCAPYIAVIFLESEGESFTVCIDGFVMDFDCCEFSSLASCDFEYFEEYQNLEIGEHDVELRVAFYDGEIQTMRFSFELCAQEGA